MLDFKDGYDFFTSNSSAAVGVQMSGEYVGTVEEKIQKLIDDLNKFEGNKSDSNILKGNVVEVWHAGTFNIKAAVKQSEHRAFVDRSHDFASADISTNYGDKYGLKYYANGQASAKAQATSIFQRFSEYKGSGGKDSLEKFLADRGYNNDTVLSDPIYSGQIRVIPRDQMEEAAEWLQRKIIEESVKRPEQVKRYQETLDMLTDRLRDNDGTESIPLSEEDSKRLAELAKQGNVDAENANLDIRNFFEFEDIMRQAFKAGITAAAISAMLKIAPEIYKAVLYLIKNGEIDGEQFKKTGFAAVSGAAEGFVRGSISAALTTYCKIGALGETLKAVDPTVIGAVTVLTMNVIKNAFYVAVDKKTKRELASELVRDMYLSACSLIGGSISQAFIEVPILGYLIGSFVGSVIGSFTYNIGQKAIISFCVDSGFTMFGLVEQDYTLPKEVLEEIGIETFDYGTFEADSFEPETFEFDTFTADTFEPDTLDITFLRRGVIGVSTVGYVL